MDRAQARLEQMRNMGKSGKNDEVRGTSGQIVNVGVLGTTADLDQNISLSLGATLGLGRNVPPLLGVFLPHKFLFTCAKVARGLANEPPRMPTLEAIGSLGKVRGWKQVPRLLPEAVRDPAQEFWRKLAFVGQGR